MKIKAILIAFILMAGSFVAIGSTDSMVMDRPVRNDEDRNFISLGGTELIDGIANVRLIGEDVPKVGGALGGYTWIGDVNGDGLNDFAVAAPMMPGIRGHDEDGTIYVFYGSADVLTGTIDLETYEPDIRIMANSDPSSRGGLALTSQMTCGDYNGDGLRDIALCTPTTTAGSHGLILYGRSEGWPGEILIPDDRSLFNATFLDYCGPYSTSMDAQTPFFMSTADVDHDGIDDLVYGGHFDDFYHPRRWNTTIAWGGFTDGGNGVHMPAITYTALEDKDSLSHFGSSVSTGDIDGDGWNDMVVGAYLKTPGTTQLEQSGEVIIYFNISALKGTELIRWDKVPHKTIEGSDEYDRFGYSVEISDIDGDGKGDIICSAPYADGPSDTDIDCGQVMIYKGGPNASFPDLMDAESGFDLMLMGPLSSNGQPAKLGQMFRLGDVTGDGTPDLVVGMKDKDLVPLGSDLRMSSGIVMVYDHLSAFGQGQGIVRLGYPSKLFTLEASDIEDGLGYHLSIGDIDNNGIDDILVSAPNADGHVNDRPRCGEAYVIYSSHLRLWDQTLSGPCYDDGTVFASFGPLTIETSIINERPEMPITSIELEIGPAEGPIRIHCSASGADLTDPYDCIEEDDIAMTMPGPTRSTSFSISFEIGWFFPERDGIDIAMTLRDEEGCILHRQYRDVFDLAKDLSFRDEVRISSNGAELPGLMSWVRVGDMVGIGDVPVVYRGHPDREVGGSDLDIVIKTTSGVHEVPYTQDWSYSEEVRQTPTKKFSLGMALAGDPVPRTPDLMPLMDSNRSIAVNVDNVPPKDPYIAKISPPNGTSSNFGRPGSWDIEIGGSLGVPGDIGGSGVRYFTVTDSDGTSIATDRGGLTGTYYSDQEMGDFALNLTDPTVDFEWGKWGPHPETFTMPPYGFSARWHGWISVDDDSSIRFQLAGRGLGMMMLDGEIHIPYDDLEYAPKGSVMDLTGGERHEVILYYRHAETNKTPSFRFQWIDPEGKLSPVPSSVLYHPSIRTNVTLTSEDPEVVVTAIDWVGLRSGDGTYRPQVDPYPPKIDTTGIPQWTRTLHPVIEFSITDQGSGIDRDSIFYRLLRDGEGYGTWTADGLIYTAKAGDLSWLNLNIDLTLENDFSGTLEIIASDLSGNLARTPPIHMAHDRTAPVIEMLYPGPEAVIKSSSVDISYLISDLNGSGVDPSSVVLKYRVDSGPWEGINHTWDSPGEEIAPVFRLFLQNGLYELEISADDMVGNHASLASDFTVEIPPVNEPPIVKIGSPANGSRTFEGWPLVLDASGTRDDGLGEFDPVKLSWFSNRSGYLGNGISIKVYLPAGTHLITLNADDGEFNVSARITVRVVVRGPIDGGEQPNDEKRSGPMEIIVAAIILLSLGFVIVFAIAIMRRYRRKTPISEE
jgi:hypothetical protein